MAIKIVFVLFALAIISTAQIDGASILECPVHSTFNGCMTRCPVTCLNLNNPPTNCISVCTVGCECMEGFIKINKSPVSQCVKMYECPMYTNKQQTLPYPMMRKLAADASVNITEPSTTHDE
ncbi:hypothetical protein BLOT_001100 [Blomia tropicalis]|nr:hypothetical protein BLOT_001100 [Blomia tropicalis]